MEDINFDELFSGVEKEEPKKVELEENRLPSFYQICRNKYVVSMGEKKLVREVLDTIKISKGLFAYYKKEAIEKAKRLGDCYVEEYPFDKSHSMVVVASFEKQNLSGAGKVLVKDGRKVIARNYMR